MRNPTTNPFNITKSVDFSDREIFEYWVDISDRGGLWELAAPRSPMPMLIMGGKGSGKTHLMRYFSYPLQKIRNKEDIVAGLKSEGYIGVYLRCGGLNSARFGGKGFSRETWMDMFAYYMELWLSQLVLSTILDAFKFNTELEDKGDRISSDIAKLFDAPILPPNISLAGVQESLHKLQREVDSAVNNCSVSGCLDVRILATRGRLVFGIPNILTSHLSSLTECIFVYLIDEFENLSEDQQKYFNTLIREKESACTFKIGARLYGVRTYSTYSADEENKEGSEYTAIRLDEFLRDDDQKYRTFARKLILKRLKEYGLLISDQLEQDSSILDCLTNWFDKPADSKFAEEETAFVLSTWKEKERPYFKALRKKLEEVLRKGLTSGVSKAEQIEEIISDLQCPPYPLLEKLNIFLFYKNWSLEGDLSNLAKSIKEECGEFIADHSKPGRYKDQMDHFKADMLAQLRRDCDQKQVYAGLDVLIDMSWGVPRNLLITLKHVFAWALFYGEDPFREKPVSIKAQQAGVSEATNWFFDDSKMIGKEGKHVQDSINRLSTLFRRIRFSDKPSECSVTALSASISETSSEAQRIIDLAQKWSLLIKVGVQRDRNTGRIDEKLQLNRMLAPRWDLPIYRRGIISLQPEEVNAIFDKDYEKNFKEVLERRTARMTAPYFGGVTGMSSGVDEHQIPLPFKND